MSTFDKFPTFLMYRMKIEHVVFSSNLIKRAANFKFPMLDPVKYFYKMAATPGPNCGEIGLNSQDKSFPVSSEFITK